MIFELPKLTYDLDALEPYFSKETLDFHYNKHHKTYVDNLNKLVVWSEFEDKELDEIVTISQMNTQVFNNACQIWNHTFYFDGLCKDWRELSDWELLDLIKAKYWSLDLFKEEFNKNALSVFGSWWVWLARLKDKDELVIAWTMNWEHITRRQWFEDVIPLLVCDVWEHAYYIDHRNRRSDYLDSFWSVVDWNVVDERYKKLNSR